MKKNILTFFIILLAGITNLTWGQLKLPPPINPTIQESWLSIPDIDTPMVAAASFPMGKYIFVITGDTSDQLSQYKHSNQVWIYDTTARTWTRDTIDFPGAPRIGAVGFSQGLAGFVAGGRKLWHPKDSMMRIRRLTGNKDTIVISRKEFYSDSIFVDSSRNRLNVYRASLLYAKMDSFIAQRDLVYSLRDNNSGKTFFVQQNLFKSLNYPDTLYDALRSGDYTLLRDYSWNHSVYRGDSLLNDFWQFSPLLPSRWRRLADLPGTNSGRAHPVGFIYKGVPHIGLGYDNDSIKFGSHIENTRTDQYIDSIKHTPIGGGLYKIDTVYGFRTVVVSTTTTFDDHINPLKDLWSYNIGTREWTRRPDFPGLARSNTTNFLMDTVAFVGLGRDTMLNFDDCYLYSPSDSSWTRTMDFPASKRHSASGFGVGFLGYVVGGIDGLPRRDFYEYNKISDAWDRLPDFPDSARGYGVAERVGLKGYFGNGSDFLSPYPEFREYLLDTNRVFITDISFDPAFTVAKFKHVDSICAGDSFYVQIKLRSEFKKDTTVFSAEFSDSSGSFFYPLSVNATEIVSQTATSIILKVKTKPDSLVTSRNYKLRIKSSDPDFTGNAYDSNIFVRRRIIIGSNPQDYTSCLGATAQFSILVPLDTSYQDTANYQWYKDGVKLTNTTKYFGLDNDTLIINNIQLSDAGNYYAIATGFCSPPATSAFAKLTVQNIPVPTISAQATNDTVCEASSKTFAINVSGTALNYRWMKGNDTLRNSPFITGSNTPSLTFNPTRLNDSGWYRCIVFENCGSRILSDSVKLNFFKKTEILEQPVNVDTVEFVDIGFKVETEGKNNTFEWFKGNTKLNNGTKYDGADTDSLTIKNLQMGDVGFYRCEVSGDCGNPVNSLLGLLEIDPMPVITEQPSDSVSDCETSTAFFSVKVDGANITYEWYKDAVKLVNGGNITGADLRTVVISNISSADEGFYHCIVSTGPYTKVISDSGKLIVKPIPPKPVIGKFGPAGLQSNVSGDVYRWYIDNVYEPTLTSATILQLTRVGDYRVRVSKDGCISELSDPFFWFPGGTGLAEVNAGSIKLYPNPATTMVDVEIPKNVTRGTVKVYDLVGKQISTTSFENATMFALNISGLNQGMYYITITSTDGNTYVGKLIKE